MLQPQLLLPQPQPLQPQLLAELMPQPPQQQHSRMMMRMIQQQLPLLPNMRNNTSLYDLERPPGEALGAALQLAYSMWKARGWFRPGADLHRWGPT